jgi:ectoine hydroxylase
MGRIEHGKTGDQTGADLERVNAALERLELVYVECQPGDAIFFDSNLLHRSDANQADYPRWSLICCYNAARNDPYKESRHPRYSKLAAVTQTAIRDWPTAGITAVAVTRDKASQ